MFPSENPGEPTSTHLLHFWEGRFVRTYLCGPATSSGRPNLLLPTGSVWLSEWLPPGDGQWSA